MENFRDRIIKEFEPHGLVSFRETLWSSALQSSDLSKIRKFLAKNNFHGIDVSLASPMDNNTTRMRWARHYDSSGQCLSLSAPTVIPSGSNHLKLTFGYSNPSLRDSGRPKVLVVANSLRMVFGAAVARELIITSFFGAEEQSTTHSDEGYASMFDTQEINLFESPPIESAEIISLPEDAALLLEKAFTQEFPSERFVLMWLAFEAIINTTMKNGSNGHKREVFFKEILKSEIINTEVYRLFKLRCEIFKEGHISNAIIEKECWSLYAALQLTILKDCAQRRAFLHGYEVAILDRTSQEN